MTLGLLLVVGALAAAGASWALGRDAAIARAGAAGGALAIAVVALLAIASPTPSTLEPDPFGAVAGTLWNGALAPNGYLRLVIALWAGSSLVLAFIAAMLRGVAGLRALLPATLAALIGATVSLAAPNPALAVVAAAATGLASVPAVLASTRAAAPGIAAREIRAAVATGLVVLCVTAVVPVLTRLIFANPDGPVSAAGSGEVAALAFGLLAMGLVLAARIGAIPWHVRVSALTDTAVPGSLPLLIAWLPLPLGSAIASVVAFQIVPLAPQVGSAQALIVAAVLLATLAAALVAFVQDDLRHAVGYITIADLGLVILAIAALDTAVWGPARAWLLTVAVTKTALAAWAAVAEDRFGTRSVPELRGWLRPSPVLGLALVLTVIASLGLPGWAVMTARLELAGRAASGPWDALLLVASMLTLPAYVRWLWIGIGAPTTHVDQAIPEFAGLGRLPARRLGAMPPSTRRDAGLPVEQEGAMGSAFAAPSVSAPAPDARESDAEPFRPASSGDVRPGTGVGARGRPARRSSSVAMAASAPEAAATAPLALLESEAAPDAETLPRRAARRSSGGAGSTANAAEMIKRHRTRLLSGAVLALALLASVVAFGGFDVARAAGELGPAVTGMESVGN